MARNAWRKTFAIMLLLLVTLPSLPVQAGNGDSEEIDTYFDSQGNTLGWRWFTCSWHNYTDGQQSGAWLLHEETHCTTGTYSYTWYEWNGSASVQSGTPPWW